MSACNNLKEVGGLVLVGFLDFCPNLSGVQCQFSVVNHASRFQHSTCRKLLCIARLGEWKKAHFKRHLFTQRLYTILKAMVAFLIIRKLNLPLHLQCNSNSSSPTIISATNRAPKRGDSKTPHLHLPCTSNWPGTGIESASSSAM